MTLQRLALVSTQGEETPPEYPTWANSEYTEQDNILFRLFVELKSLLSDSSEVFIALNAIWANIDTLVDASHRRLGEPSGVVVVADSRFVRWPGRRSWLDLWEQDRECFDHVVEASLRITTAIHLQAMLQPLQEVE